MMVATFRDMRESDIDEAVDLEQRVYAQAWSPQVFRDELAQSTRRYIVAEVGGTLVGYGGLMVVGDEAHITTVVVDPDRRQERLGTRLLLVLVDSALEWGASSLTLEVRSSNQAAQALYRRFGMAPVGLRKRYYRDEDALVMWAHDIDTPEYRARLDQIRERLA